MFDSFRTMPVVQSVLRLASKPRPKVLFRYVQAQWTKLQVSNSDLYASAIFGQVTTVRSVDVLGRGTAPDTESRHLSLRREAIVIKFIWRNKALVALVAVAVFLFIFFSVSSNWQTYPMVLTAIGIVVTTILLIVGRKRDAH